jgi:hypothetical protein
MTTDLSRTTSDLRGVADVDGADPALRAEVTRSGADVEAATAALRDALQELHRADDEAWRRYAVDLEEATRRFDTTLGLAAARLRAERAVSKEDLGSVLDDVVQTWRTRADEMRVRAHVGEMDVRDKVGDTLGELDLATQRLGIVLARLQGGVGETLSAMRTEVAEALDDVTRILRGLPARH